MAQRKLHLTIDEHTHARLCALAEANGFSLSAFVKANLDALCADERAKGGRAVAGVLLLNAACAHPDVIAETLGVGRAVVDRVIDTWRGRDVAVDPAIAAGFLAMWRAEAA